VIVQLYAAVGKTVEAIVNWTPAAELDKMGYVNQHGLSRKVGDAFSLISFPVPCFMTLAFVAHFRFCEEVIGTTSA
jgi:hypothetical protein